MDRGQQIDSPAVLEYLEKTVDFNCPITKRSYWPGILNVYRLNCAAAEHTAGTCFHMESLCWTKELSVFSMCNMLVNASDGLSERTELSKMLCFFPQSAAVSHNVSVQL